MKSLRFSLLTAALLVSFTGAHASETYTLDSSHTNIDFRINHFGFSSPSGKFTKAEGTLVLDEEKPENSKLNVTLSPANIVTGVEKLDEHLKSKDFFDVAQFPTATFVSNNVTLTGKEDAKVTGDLTLHGVTKPVTLQVHLNKIGTNMMKLKTAGFSASTTLKRSDFGITAYVPNLADEVLLTVEAEANVKPEPTTKN